MKQVRSRASVAGCKATDSKGGAFLAIGLDPDARYTIVVGQQEASPPGNFVLDVLAAQPAEGAPGRFLAGGHVTSTLNGLTDVNDIWWVTLRAGQMYRIALNSTGCPNLVLSGKAGELETIECKGYTTFTPGPDGGGRYVLELRTTPTTKTVAYHLAVAASDPGRRGGRTPARKSLTVRASLQPHGVDLVDSTTSMSASARTCDFDWPTRQATR